MVRVHKIKESLSGTSKMQEIISLATSPEILKSAGVYNKQNAQNINLIHATIMPVRPHINCPVGTRPAAHKSESQRDGITMKRVWTTSSFSMKIIHLVLL